MSARLVLGTALVLAPFAAYPLGLGKLKVHSALNEPLKAEIEFTSITDAELKGLSTSLASRADFEAAGAERLPFLSQIKFNVVSQPNGRYVLELKTDQAVQEPFLHLLLQLEWPGGRLVREYSALIDPPYYAAGKPSGIEPPRTAAPAPAPVVEPPAPAAQPPVAAAPTAEVAPPPAVRTPPTDAKATETPPAGTEPKTSEVPAPVSEAVDTETFGPEQRREVVISDSGWPEEDLAPKVEPLEPRATEAEAPSAPSAAPGPVEPVLAAVAPPANEYAVKRGDTLWAIAERHRTDKSVSLEQMSLAIYRHNREAFFGNNLNNLRAGKILKMPESEQVTTTPAAEARREFRAQYDSWQEYKLKLAASGALKVAAAKPASVEPTAAATPEPPTPPPPPKAESARVMAGPEDRSKQPDELLRIVRGTLAGQKTTPDKKAAQGETPKEAARNEQNALAERVSTLDESLESKQLEQKELSDKLGQVRSQIKNESRLLELENPGLAKVQTEATSPAKSETPAATAPKVEPPKAEAAKPETKAEAPKSEATPLPPATPTPATPVETTKPAPAPKKVAPPPAPEKGFFASLMDDIVSGSLLPIVGGVLVLVGGVVLMVYLRRRQRSIAEFEESILASDAVPTDSAATSDTTGQAATTGDTSFLSDFSQGGMGHVHTDDVDPIAEAEVYLAYGRDETAEEILKEAVVKHPERHELKLKLLEIYHQRNDAAAFETLAEELYAALAGRGGKVWDKVEEMGRKLNPDNPMFRGGAPGARRADDQNTVRPATIAAATAVAAAPAATDATEIADFDFDVGDADTKKTSADDFSLDFPQASTARASEAAPTVAVPPPSAPADDGLDGLDLDRAFADNVVEFSSSASVPETPAEPEVVDLGTGAAADDEIRWDIDAPMAEAATQESGVPAAGGNGADPQQWDETATKLDLAKAYIDMGDSEGARSILDEVLAEGNEDQKKQAAELAAQIA